MNARRVTPNAATDRGSLCTDVEVALALAKSVRTINRFVARGMPSIKTGQHRLFDLAAVSAWCADNCAAQSPAELLPVGRRCAARKNRTPSHREGVLP
jgi:hypothetical protein